MNQNKVKNSQILATRASFAEILGTEGIRIRLQNTNSQQ